MLPIIFHWIRNLARYICRLPKRNKLKYTIIASTCLMLSIFFMSENSRKLLRRDNSLQELPHADIKNLKDDIKSVKNQYFSDHKFRNLLGTKPNCTRYPADLVGLMVINPNITPTYEEIKPRSSPDLAYGGCFTPSSCIPLQKVAIVIPFKDREAHLKTLLYYLHPMLQRQMIHYCIYVAEQYDTGQFNKAMIMNAGFEEAMKIDDYDCIIFHDVDMIPENDKNFYRCGPQPRHLSPAIDKFDYKPHYGTEFGGVTAITPEQYRKANGHSNEFWGWGGEDNDMEFRIQYNGMKIDASPLKIGRYCMIKHKHSWKFSENPSVTRLNKTCERRAKTDGLSNLQYRTQGSYRHSLYTKFYIDIRLIEIKGITLNIDGVPAMEIDVKPGPCRWEEYEEKFLDFSIELSGLKEASHLKPLSINYLHKRSIASHESTPQSTAPVRFSLMDNFTEAINICEKLFPECQGVQRENNIERYSLRRSNFPRDIEIKGPMQPIVSQNNNDKLNKLIMKQSYYFPKKNSFVKYCPGQGFGMQAYRTPLVLDLNAKNKFHKYNFQVHFNVLLQAPKYLLYSDRKRFEAQATRSQNFYTFRWPKQKVPDLNDPNVTTEYNFKTVDFNIPNVPGCYAVRSQLLDNHQNPYFTWNWWFEIKSDDKERDAMLREEFWKDQMNYPARPKLTQLGQSKMTLNKEQDMKKDTAKSQVVKNADNTNENGAQFQISKSEQIFKPVRQQYHAALPAHLLKKPLK